MNRSLLIHVLQNYHPTAPEELEYKDTILAFVHANPDCFERSLAIGHITASALLLNKAQSHALLMHHRKLDKWVQLGGHCDGNPDVLSVAIKEAQEESGILGIAPVSHDIFDIDIHLIPANSKEQEHYHYDIRYLLRVTSDEDFVQNSESKELRWVDKDLSTLPTQSHSVIRMFNKWIQKTV